MLFYGNFMKFSVDEKKKKTTPLQLQGLHFNLADHSATETTVWIINLRNVNYLMEYVRVQRQD